MQVGGIRPTYFACARRFNLPRGRLVAGARSTEGSLPAQVRFTLSGEGAMKAVEGQRETGSFP